MEMINFLSFKKSSSLYFFASLLILSLYYIYNFYYLGLEFKFPDELRFVDSAIHLANAKEFRVGSYWQFEMPGTAFLYSFFYILTGTKLGILLMARVIQPIMLIFIAFFASGIASKYQQSNDVKFCSFLFTAFYPFLVFFQALALSELLFIFFLTGAFYYLYRVDSK